ncbi:glycoside hydrolase family 97 catalytic domain-containing protein [Paenibacillus tarimensis]
MSEREIGLASPDGTLEVSVRIARKTGLWGISYGVRYAGRTLLQDSPLGLVMDGDTALEGPFEVEVVGRCEHDEWWEPPYGERSRIRDRYSELVVLLRERSHRHRSVRLIFRAYEEGVAFHYAFPERFGNGRLAIREELTTFRFPIGCMAYEEHGTEGEYVKKSVHELGVRCERPLTVEYPNDMYVCLTEGGLTDFARMLLTSTGDGAIVAHLDGPVEAEMPFRTPWRAVIIGERPGHLLERNILVLNLNEPCALADVSWIKPGKVIREMTLSTAGGKRCVDFAVRMNFQYIEYDAGWYGHEYDDVSDATFVSVDPDRIKRLDNHDGLDLREVIDYANRHGIGVLLYVNRRALERQLEELLPLYKSWGVKGIKPGFVQVDSQHWTRWLTGLVEKCAEYRLVLDIHDEHRPTGFSRTYPNLLTQEGIRGNEHFPTARHNATLPFTRYPAGAGDYTICIYDDRLKTTRAHQLAMAVIAYSPLQFLFWYDRPEQYRGEPELDFFRHVPVTWDDTIVSAGEIGEYAVVARRSGQEWFLGAITNEQARSIGVELNFLDPGRTYRAIRYADGEDGTVIMEQEINRETYWALHMAASGGVAVRFVPES